MDRPELSDRLPSCVGTGRLAVLARSRPYRWVFPSDPVAAMIATLEPYVGAAGAPPVWFTIASKLALLVTGETGCGVADKALEATT
jgi:hypothetical protein